MITSDTGNKISGISEYKIPEKNSQVKLDTQSKKNSKSNSPCTPQYIKNNKSKNSTCERPVYEKKSGIIKKLNNIEGKSGDIYVDYKTDIQLNEKEKEIFRREGIETLSIFKRDKDTVKYNKDCEISVSSDSFSRSLKDSKHVTFTESIKKRSSKSKDTSDFSKSKDTSDCDFSKDTSDFSKSKDTSDFSKSKDTSDCDFSKSKDTSDFSKSKDTSDCDFSKDTSDCDFSKVHQNKNEGTKGIIFTVIAIVIIIIIILCLCLYYYWYGSNSYSNKMTDAAVTGSHNYKWY